MALFVLRKLSMRNYPVGLDVWFFVGPFVYVHVCKQQVAYAINTKISWTGSFYIIQVW